MTQTSSYGCHSALLDAEHETPEIHWGFRVIAWMLLDDLKQGDGGQRGTRTPDILLVRQAL